MAAGHRDQMGLRSSRSERAAVAGVGNGAAIWLERAQTDEFRNTFGKMLADEFIAKGSCLRW